GHLVIAGHDVEELAPKATFEQVTAMLWAAGGLPNAPADVRRALGAARAEAFARLPKLGEALARADGLDALRAAIGALAATGELATDAVAATGAMAVFAAAWVRGRSGLAAVEPDAAASHAADYLRMVTGEPSSAARATALDRYLVTVSDHGMNA